MEDVEREDINVQSDDEDEEDVSVSAFDAIHFFGHFSSLEMTNTG